MKALPALAVALLVLRLAAAQTPEQSSRADESLQPAETAELVESSREAGLLTDWHLEGRFGNGAPDEIAHRYAPERSVLRQAAKKGDQRFFRNRRFPRLELVFPDGGFTLPEAQSGRSGVFYATSIAYLMGSGDWILYLESGGAAVLFFDGRPMLSRTAESVGVLRKTIHAEAGYHSVMVKFLAASAPFRVAVLPPNSGSHRKNNTPYLRAVPLTEEMMAQAKLCPNPIRTRE
jgi:hypothetical protein